MNILDVADYYIKNLKNPTQYKILQENITRNCSSVFNQIQIILNNKAERERAIEEIRESLAQEPDSNKNTKRFTISEITPLKSQKQIMRFQTEDLISRGVLKIRTNIDLDNLSEDVISNFHPEEQNLIITLVLEHIIDKYNEESYAYTLEYLLLLLEDEIIHKLTPLDGYEVNIILLASVRTLLSYILAEAIFNDKIKSKKNQEYVYKSPDSIDIFDERISEHNAKTYAEYIKSRVEFTTIEKTFIFMNEQL